jgi:hypothetical protein
MKTALSGHLQKSPNKYASLSFLVARKDFGLGFKGQGSRSISGPILTMTHHTMNAEDISPTALFVWISRKRIFQARIFSRRIWADFI